MRATLWDLRAPSYTWTDGRRRTGSIKVSSRVSGEKPESLLEYDEREWAAMIMFATHPVFEVWSASSYYSPASRFAFPRRDGNTNTKPVSENIGFDIQLYYKISHLCTLIYNKQKYTTTKSKLHTINSLKTYQFSYTDRVDIHRY